MKWRSHPVGQFLCTSGHPSLEGVCDCRGFCWHSNNGRVKAWGLGTVLFCSFPFSLSSGLAPFLSEQNGQAPGTQRWESPVCHLRSKITVLPRDKAQALTCLFPVLWAVVPLWNRVWVAKASQAHHWACEQGSLLAIFVNKGPKLEKRQTASHTYVWGREEKKGI